MDTIKPYNQNPKIQFSDINVEKTSFTPAQQSNENHREGFVEGATVNDLTNLYNSIKDSRKYEMDTKIALPPNHPEYIPTDADIVVADTSELLNHQYNSLVMTVAATASLGLIAYMITTSGSTSQ
jgi:hypothetical protein